MNHAQQYTKSSSRESAMLIYLTPSGREPLTDCKHLQLPRALLLPSGPSGSSYQATLFQHGQSYGRELARLWHYRNRIQCLLWPAVWIDLCISLLCRTAFLLSKPVFARYILVPMMWASSLLPVESASEQVLLASFQHVEACQQLSTIINTASASLFLTKPQHPSANIFIALPQRPSNRNLFLPSSIIRSLLFHPLV